jgi:SAM-dependent methyltransferase
MAHDDSRAISMAEAYSCSAAAWREGPSRIYDRLAADLVARVPPLAGATALDLGAGTGPASAALTALGAHVLATDIAMGMLRIEASSRPPCVVADALGLPWRDGAFDVVVAAFVLNHLADPAAGLREAARVTRSGGLVLASAYATSDDHPVKEAVAEAACAAGWAPSAWMHRVRSAAMPKLATIAGARREAAAAGVKADVELVRVAIPGLDADALIAWRLGMPDLATFVATLPPAAVTRLREEARDRLGDVVAPLIRSVIVITVRR